MLEPAYLMGCPGGGQSACILTLTTSVGRAEMTARAPVVIPAKMRMPAGGLLVFDFEDNISQYKSLTASYSPIRTDAKHICRWRPGTSPLYSARAPSSLLIVLMVPITPRYLKFLEAI